MRMSFGVSTRSSQLRQIISAISIAKPVSSRVNCRVDSRFFVIGSFASGQRIDQASSFTSQIRHFSEMPRPIVYTAAASPPSRSVLLAAAALGIDIEVRNVDLRAGEHLTKEFKKINPEHTVPTLNDDGFGLWDSHAIMCYLADKYAKDDSLYPKDLCRRALINQRLHFESGVLFPRLRFISFPLFMGQTNNVPSEKLELLRDAYVHLNNFLEGKKWLAGDSYTLADISCVTTISSIQCVLPIDEYPNIKAWLKRCEDTLPGYEKLNAPGCKLFHELITSRITQTGKL